MSMRKTKKIVYVTNQIVVLLSLLCVFSVSAHAATFYVRKGASGNGVSWSTAWNDINNISGIGPGDTIYIAAGNYTGSYTANSSGWTFKRATIGEHGSDTGWNNAFDGTVNLNTTNGNTFTLSGRNTITIDGVNRGYFILNGSSSRDYGVKVDAGYKITIKNATIHNYFRAGIKFYGTTGGMEIHNCEIYNTGYQGAEDTDGIIVINNCSGVQGNNIIANNYLHDPGINNQGSNLDTVASSGTSYLYIYNNIFEPGWEMDSSADLISIRAGTDRYIYNNLFKMGKYNRNQNIFISGSNGNVSNTYIYNNLFYQDPTTPQDGPAQPINIAWFGEGGYNYYLKGLYVYNNTFYGHVYGFTGGSNAEHVQDIVIKNNIFHATWPSGEIYLAGSPINTKMTVDYNFYYQTAGGYIGTIGGVNRTLADVRSLYGWEVHGGEGDPQFQSLGENGFHLSSSSPAIVTRMAQPDPGSGLFTTDKNGNSCGLSNWSMGAYQDVMQNVMQKSNILPSPSNLKIIN